MRDSREKGTGLRDQPPRPAVEIASKFINMINYESEEWPSQLIFQFKQLERGSASSFQLLKLEN